MRLNFLITLLPLLQLIACDSLSTKATETEIDTVVNINNSNHKEVVCFVYHRFGDDRYPSTNVSLSDFEAHLNYLKKNDYQVLSFSDAAKYLKSDAEQRKTAVITIDDGYKSFFKNGLPLLKKHGYPATLFINTETVGGGDYMNWEEIKQSMIDKVEIGNHTHSHDYFLNLPTNKRYAAFEEEIKLSRQLIEKNTDLTPIVFAYPYGELDLKMKEIVERNGFVAAAAQNSGVIHSNSDLIKCPRFPMSEAYADIDKFKNKAQMSALRVLNISPTSFIMPNNDSKPTLEITFDAADLQLDQLQCFIQGAECQLNMTKSDGKVMLSLSPSSPIDSRRRTLYTVTVPDKNGKWHWFSHLFINPKVN